MEVQSVPVNSQNSEDKFHAIVHGIREWDTKSYKRGARCKIDMTKSSGINSHTKRTKEDEWIVMISKSKKKQHQFGEINKINRFGKTG